MISLLDTNLGLHKSEVCIKKTWIW